MTAITDLVPRVRAVVPMLPSFVAQQYILQASRDFFEFTRAWRTSFNLDETASTATYDISADLPTGTELVDVISIKPQAGGARLTPTTFVWLDEEITDWRNTEANDANWYVIDSNNTLRLIYTPSTTTTDKYYVRVAVKPTFSATTIDDLMNNKYDQALIDGAVGLLSAIPNKPWSSGEMAAFHLSKFEAAKIEGESQANDENQKGARRKMRYGGIGTTGKSSVRYVS
jgi:hypothetical protein